MRDKTVIVTWLHTRTQEPQTRTFPSFGQAMLFVWNIRCVHPKHPMQLNGKDV